MINPCSTIDRDVKPLLVSSLHRRRWLLRAPDWHQADRPSKSPHSIAYVFVGHFGVRQ